MFFFYFSQEITLLFFQKKFSLAVYDGHLNDITRIVTDSVLSSVPWYVSVSKTHMPFTGFPDQCGPVGSSSPIVS